MTPAELRFRASCASRIWRDRLRHRLQGASWDRRTLASKLAITSPALRDVAQSLRAGDSQQAEDLLSQHFRTRTSHWPIAAREQRAIADTIAHAFPAASQEAVARARRIVDGRYDLLGYRDLAYGASPDWHLDVVHDRRAPRTFWADVPYLDPSCGDHKVIWELNRHQHWTSLGRAFWLDRSPQYATTFVDQLYSWLEANPPLTGVNWASMLELAFRTMSWAWTVEFFAPVDASLGEGRPWRVDLLLALDRQLGHIAENLSRYFSPNTHLSGEALALYTVSLAFPELRDSPARAALGRGVLLAEARRQILADGGHAERSTHYHRYSTDFYLLAAVVARRAGDAAAEQLTASAQKQARVLRTLADDTGALATIGDDDGGQLFAMCGTSPADVRTTLAIAAAVCSDPALAVSPPTEEACWVAGADLARDWPETGPAPGWPSRLLPDSGYFVSRAGGELAIFDAGRHGFLNGGHAHADALALVTATGGAPLLIDPGTGTYTIDPPMRDRLRSGRVHNTVLLDGGEHAIARGPFHWRTTTDARFLATRIEPAGDVAQGLHDGYPHVRHARTLFVVHGIGWLVIDQVLGTGSHVAEASWHVHPSWTLGWSGHSILLEHPHGLRSRILSSAATVDIVRSGPDAIYAPEYGRIEPAPFIRTVAQAAAPFALATLVATDAAITSNATIDVEICLADAGWNGVCVNVAGPYLDIRALAAAPCRPPDGAPEALWAASPYGTDRARTDGRAAIRVRSHNVNWECIVEGTELRCGHPAPLQTSELAASVREGAR